MNTFLENCQLVDPLIKNKRLIGGATGVLYDIFNFQPWMINLHDIATGLSKKCRWNGQIETDEIFSVAQHSVYVAWLCGSDPYDRLAGILHDASEGVMVDMITPMKAPFKDFVSVENDVQDKIYTHFGVEMTDRRHEIVNTADRLCLHLEANEFERTIGGGLLTTEKLFERFTGHRLMNCKEARKFWIAEFNTIMAEILTR